MTSNRDELMRLADEWANAAADIREAGSDPVSNRVAREFEKCAADLRALAQRAPQHGAVPEASQGATPKTWMELKHRGEDGNWSDWEVCDYWFAVKRTGDRDFMFRTRTEGAHAPDVPAPDPEPAMVPAFRTSLAYDVGFKDGKKQGCGRCVDMTKPCDISGGNCAADETEADQCAAPAPEASKCGPACARCGSTTGVACDERGCGYLAAGNGAPEAERAEVSSNCDSTCNCSLHVESPPSAGQPDGVEALFDAIREAVEESSPRWGDAHDNPMLHKIDRREREWIASRVFAAIASRLASAQWAEGDNTK